MPPTPIQDPCLEAESCWSYLECKRHFGWTQRQSCGRVTIAVRGASISIADITHGYDGYMQCWSSRRRDDDVYNDGMLEFGKVLFRCHDRMQYDE